MKDYFRVVGSGILLAAFIFVVFVWTSLQLALGLAIGTVGLSITVPIVMWLMHEGLPRLIDRLRARRS